MSAGLRVTVMIAFFVAMSTGSALLSMIWPPLGAAPALIYVYWAVRWNLKRCVCSHRYISHNPHMGWCFRCTNEDDLWEYDAHGDLKPLFCTGFRTVSDEALQMLRDI